MSRLVMRNHVSRPPTVRRSVAGTGEIKTYQELIRIAVMRKRLLADVQRQGQGSEEARKNLAVIEKYREDLLGRLGVLTPAAAAAGIPPKTKPGQSSVGEGLVVTGGAKEFKYCGSGQRTKERMHSGD